jgi:hypothetical protein
VVEVDGEVAGPELELLIDRSGNLLRGDHGARARDGGDDGATEDVLSLLNLDRPRDDDARRTLGIDGGSCPGRRRSRRGGPGRGGRERDHGGQRVRTRRCPGVAVSQLALT